MRKIFELSPNQVQIREVMLNQPFLEIEIYAISDANPNRNKSYFTVPSMEKGLQTFTNKPIMGYFNKNKDFEEHNAKINYDSDLQIEYWDNTNGEQILGFIRESDKVELVERDGLTWIRCTAMVYTQYNFQQVKRLLMDKKKKVSVEVSITDSKVENGIENIYAFDLVGITILGSLNGIPIEEGIEGAALTLLAKYNQEEFSGQKRALSFAYKQLDNKIKKEDNNLEGQVKNPEIMAVDDSTPVPADGIEVANPKAEPTAMSSDVATLQAKNQELTMACDELNMKCAKYEADCGKYKTQNEEYAVKVEALEKCKKDFEVTIEKMAKELSAEKHSKQVEYINKAKSDFGLSEDETKTMIEKCAKNEFATIEQINKEIAYALFLKKDMKVAKKSDEFAVGLVMDGNETDDDDDDEKSIDEKLKANV